MLSPDMLMNLAMEIRKGLELTEERLRSRAEAPQTAEGDPFFPAGVISGHAGGRDVAADFAATVSALFDEGRVVEADLAAKLGCHQEDVEALRRRVAHRPSRELVTLLSLALELSPEKAEQLFLASGYELLDYEVYDIVIRYCLEHGVYDIDDVNEALLCFNLKSLSQRAIVVELDRRAWGASHDRSRQ